MSFRILHHRTLYASNARPQKNIRLHGQPQLQPRTALQHCIGNDYLRRGERTELCILRRVGADCAVGGAADISFYTQ